MIFDVVVTGRSIPALISALDCAEVGLSVCITDDPTGVEPPRQPLTDPDGHVRDMLRRVAAPIEGSDAAANADVQPREAQPEPTHLRDVKGDWAPQSEPSVFGIPATPLDAAVIRLIGTKGAFRAYVDRIRPVLTVGKTKLMSVLVRQRMGAQVLERLVDPLLRHRFGVGADRVDVAVAAPGLNEAITRQGSLSTAVLAYADRFAARETLVAPAGGGEALHAQLMRKLSAYNVHITNETTIETQRHESGWRLQLTDGTLVEARALVLDAGRAATPSELQLSLFPALTVPHTRCIAVIEGATATEQPRGTTRLTVLPGWSVRHTVTTAGASTVTVLSDVQHDATSHPDRSELTAVLAAAGVTAQPESTWQCGVAAAPFATLAERDSALARVDAISTADPYAIAVGRSLHGDDLGAALHQAATRTLVLRRRLIGLID